MSEHHRPTERYLPPEGTAWPVLSFATGSDPALKDRVAIFFETIHGKALFELDHDQVRELIQDLQLAILPSDGASN